MNIKRILLTVLSAGTVLGLYWIGGGEFERGGPLAAALVLTLLWNERNPNHKGWVDPLYTAATVSQPIQPASRAQLQEAFAQGMSCRPASAQRPG